jgi:NtrC-family two-component system sensor histidine kinase KinB
VLDDGPGIPPEYHSKIFQKFVQVKGQEAGGTGLGLAICKEIVRAHGGAIWVESPAGRGSTFTFTLPVAQ